MIRLEGTYERRDSEWFAEFIPLGFFAESEREVGLELAIGKWFNKLVGDVDLRMHVLIDMTARRWSIACNKPELIIIALYKKILEKHPHLESPEPINTAMAGPEKGDFDLALQIKMHDVAIPLVKILKDIKDARDFVAEDGQVFTIRADGHGTFYLINVNELDKFNSCLSGNPDGLSEFEGIPSFHSVYFRNPRPSQYFGA